MIDFYFENPILLTGLACCVIPWLLPRREKTEPIRTELPTMAVLAERLQLREHNELIRHRILVICRTIMIALLVLLLAGPRWSEQTEAMGQVDQHGIHSGNIMIVDGASQPGAMDQSSTEMGSSADSIRRALAVTSVEPGEVIRIVSPSEFVDFPRDSLDEYRSLVLTDLALPSEVLVRQLKIFAGLQESGTLRNIVLFFGEKTDTKAWNRYLLPLGLCVRDREVKSDMPLTLHDHTVTRPFIRHIDSGLDTLPVREYFPLEFTSRTASLRMPGQTILTCDSGRILLLDATGAMSHERLPGHWILCGTSPDRRMGAMGLSPAFVPFMDRLCRPVAYEQTGGVPRQRAQYIPSLTNMLFYGLVFLFLVETVIKMKAKRI